MQVKIEILCYILLCSISGCGECDLLFILVSVLIPIEYQLDFLVW